jgi:hypothetical protein
MDTLLAVQALNLVAHQDIGGFGLRVPETRIVAAVLVEIVEVHDSVAVGAGCDVDYAGVEGWSGGGEERWTQKLEQ